MFNTIVNSFLQEMIKTNAMKLPLAGLMLAVAAATSNAAPNPTPASAITAAPHQLQVAQAQPQNQNSQGVYLYGQSAKPDEIGKEYVVFEVRQGRVIGAVYMPSSEFNCFHGTMQAQKLNLIVANPFAETADSSPPEDRPNNEFAAVGDFPRVGNGEDPINFPLAINLQEYQRLARVSENDQRILGMCKADYQDQVWGR
jgi:hypothetical protein